MYETLLFRCFKIKLPKDILQTNGHVRRTVLPVICDSDETPLTNFNGNKKAYTKYLILSNIRLDICSRHSKLSINLLTLLPVDIKHTGTSIAADKACRTFHVNQLQQVLEFILHLLKVPGTHGCNFDCADGKIRD